MPEVVQENVGEQVTDLRARLEAAAREDLGLPAPRPRRTTHRKLLIRGVLDVLGHGRPMLLEELRWHVYRAELRSRGKAAERMSRSYRESFNRTVRLMDQEERSIHLTRLAAPMDQSMGLIVRAAVYRIQDANILRHLFNCGNLAVHVGWETSGIGGYGIPREKWRAIATIRCGFAFDSFLRVAGVFDHVVRIPVNHELRMISLYEPRAAELVEMGCLPRDWAIILDGWDRPYRMAWHTPIREATNLAWCRICDVDQPVKGRSRAIRPRGVSLPEWLPFSEGGPTEQEQQ